MAEQIALVEQQEEQQRRQEEEEAKSNGRVPPQLGFDPSRSELNRHQLLRDMRRIYKLELIGIIRRKALIKDLAAVYHAECLSYCQELLELQKKWEETYVDTKASDDMQRETMRQPKRLKKSR